MSKDPTFSKARLQEVYWKSCSHEGFLNIFIYRKIALRWAVVAAKLHLTPNQVTMISFVASAIACGLFVTGEFSLWLWALIPFHVGKILDCTDGILAKLTNQTSAYGAFLDPFLDRIIDTGVLLSLAIGYFARTGNPLGVYLVTALLIAWYIAAYLDNHSEKGAKALDNLRSTTKGMPVWLRRLAKWDGGFSGFITTLAVVTVQIPVLIGLFLLVTILPIPLQFKAIYRRLHQS